MKKNEQKSRQEICAFYSSALVFVIAGLVLVIVTAGLCCQQQQSFKNKNNSIGNIIEVTDVGSQVTELLISTDTQHAQHLRKSQFPDIEEKTHLVATNNVGVVPNPITHPAVEEAETLNEQQESVEESPSMSQVVQVIFDHLSSAFNFSVPVFSFAEDNDDLKWDDYVLDDDNYLMWDMDDDEYLMWGDDYDQKVVLDVDDEWLQFWHDDENNLTLDPSTKPEPWLTMPKSESMFADAFFNDEIHNVFGNADDYFDRRS